MHGGVHNVLKDKVKRDTVFLKDDYIVRIEGRASPFNINRMTFFTAKGKQFGPWGDRRSQVSKLSSYCKKLFQSNSDCSFRKASILMLQLRQAMDLPFSLEPLTLEYL